MVGQFPIAQRVEALLREIPGVVRASELLKPMARRDATKPAHHDNGGCVPGGVVDMLDLGDKRPTTGQLRGFGGREDEHGGIARGCNGVREL
jgi:hypothetical protein